MGCAGLKCLSVLHHRLDRQGVERACEPFVRALVADDDRESHGVAGEVGIDIHHLFSLCGSFFRSGMGSVALLPEEFRSTEEEAGPHLPADHVAPLVAEDRKIPP